MGWRPAAVTICLALCPGVLPAQETATPPRRPPWVEDGVPDTVWILAEASAGSPDHGRSRALLKDAEALARAALQGRDADLGLHFALAVVLGLQADREGPRAKVRDASAMYAQVKEILARDPQNARAHGLMGRLEAGVLRMGRVTRWIATTLLGGDELKGATWEGAERHLVFAATRAPEVSDHHLQLAYLYKDTGRPGLEAVEVRQVLAMPATSPMEIAVLREAETLARELPAG